jgi:hypothetical protein
MVPPHAEVSLTTVGLLGVHAPHPEAFTDGEEEA